MRRWHLTLSINVPGYDDLVIAIRRYVSVSKGTARRMSTMYAC